MAAAAWVGSWKGLRDRDLEGAGVGTWQGDRDGG